MISSVSSFHFDGRNRPRISWGFNNQVVKEIKEKMRADTEPMEAEDEATVSFSSPENATCLSDHQALV